MDPILATVSPFHSPPKTTIFENENELASILLSLKSTRSSDEHSRQMKRPKLDQIKVQYPIQLPSVENILLGLNSGVHPFPNNRAKKWKSCPKVVQAKYPHLVEYFNFNGVLDRYSRQFLRDHGIFEHLMAIPVELESKYLQSIHDIFLPRKDQVNKRIYNDENVSSNSYTEIVCQKVPDILSRESSIASDSTEDSNPRIQPIRFPEDLYTPRMVRFSGAKKEGLCDLCSPNRWLQLKDSAFWFVITNIRYHKQFFHGISSSTGLAFKCPIEYRTVWTTAIVIKPSISVNLMTEGLCHQCNLWIPMFKSKKRHAHYFASTEQIKALLVGGNSHQSISAEILSEDPLTMMVGRNPDGSIHIPPSISISMALLKEISSHEKGQHGAVWWRHAHKCQ